MDLRPTSICANLAILPGSCLAFPEVAVCAADFSGQPVLDRTKSGFFLGFCFLKNLMIRKYKIVIHSCQRKRMKISEIFISIDCWGRCGRGKCGFGALCHEDGWCWSASGNEVPESPEARGEGRIPSAKRWGNSLYADPNNLHFDFRRC